MKHFGWLLLLALATTVVAQTASKSSDSRPVKKNPLAPYAGTWTATLDGKTWLTLKLALQGEQMTGSIQRPHDVTFANSGEVKSVSDEQLNEAVESAQINNDGLLLTVKDAEAKESNRFLMRLTTDTAAELKMLAMSMPPGMPKPRPWQLTRVAGTGAPAAR